MLGWLSTDSRKVPLCTGVCGDGRGVQKESPGISEVCLVVVLGRIRHPKVPLEDRVCRLCNVNLGEIEDTTHFLITCPLNNRQCKLFNECIIINYHSHFYYLTPLQNYVYSIIQYPSVQITNLNYA